MANGATGAGAGLVANYVAALEIRRKCHAAGALFNAKHPCGSSPVAGGVTDIATTTKIQKFAQLMDEVRDFVNTKYIPDVVAVAGLFPALWNVGRGCLNALSYGDFPDPSDGNRLLKRGRVSFGTTYRTVDPSRIREYVKYSHYDDATTGQHPSIGATEPSTLKMLGLAGSSYSWLKAPRYLATGSESKAPSGTWTSGQAVPHEVGPLARVLATVYHSAADGADVSVSQAANANSGRSVTAIGALTTEYTMANLAGWAMSTYSVQASMLWSPLGRHLTRALETKFIADAMCGTSGSVTSWLDRLVIGNPSYTQVNIPEGFNSGVGLVEAPRGALGHWITIADKKIFNYQCVVPSTWNASPMDDDNTRGPAEQTLIGASLSGSYGDQILTVLRYLHPFDFCIACAVHLVNADGKELAKVAFDPNGRMTEFIVNE